MTDANAERCARCAVLEDLLETAYHRTELARVEAEKADDEAMELKAAMIDMRFQNLKADRNLVWSWKRRAEAAEAALKADQESKAGA